MSVTIEQLDRFHEFATQRLANGGVDSMASLFAEWTELEAACEDIRRGIENMEAGRGIPLEQVFREIREKHGVPEAD